VNLKLYSDSTALTSAFQSKEVDVAFNVPATNAGQLKKSSIVTGSEGVYIWGLYLNAAKPPFNDPKVRMALAYAVNRQGIVDAVLGGASKPAVLPWAPSSAAYDPAALKQYAFNLKKAKQLLADAGQSNGSAEVIVSTANPELTQMAQIIQSDLKKIGFTLNIATLDPTAYLARYFPSNFQIAATFAGNTVKYPTAITGSGPFKLANNILFAGGSPPAEWGAAITAANGALDKASQKAAFSQMRKAFLDNGPWATMIADNNLVYAVSTKVMGFDTTVESKPLWAGVSLTKV